ncbi:E3 ubiquitin- ligase HECTD1 [Brachionus plicatilis]|uniref:E3 ubiquitin-ligase HECTD1 n=1 Tax=Brachionus plicatilis TaxID=10195 RepID=A0A3M7PHP1_BRAPC|nr:E3 ubiquitin- ligase HECTD1 [Brachionus plicatilis]
MVVKQWYDYERDGLTFLSSLSHQLPIRFEYESAFDQNGLLYWIGSNERTQDWINPCSHSFERRLQKRLLARSSLQKQMVLGAMVQRGVEWKWANLLNESNDQCSESHKYPDDAF